MKMQKKISRNKGGQQLRFNLANINEYGHH